MFVEFYKKASKSEYEKLAFDYLVKDKLDAIFSHDNQSQQLTAMQMESKFSTPFIPSMIYTFSYETNMKQKMGKYSFYDIVPVILCTSFDGNIITGINFNFIPTGIRAIVLDIIYEAFKSFYDNDIDKAIQQSSSVINESFAKLLMPDNGKGFIGLLDSKLNISISSAYRTYKASDVKNVRLLEYDEWKYIPFLVFKDAIRGASLAKVQKEMIDNSNQ